MQANQPFRYLAENARQRLVQNPDDNGETAPAKRKPARRSLLHRVAGLFRKNKADAARETGKKSRRQQDDKRKARARGGRIVSYAVFKEMVFSAFKATNAAKFIDAASRQDGLRVFYVSTPFPSVAIVDTARGGNFARLIAEGRTQDAVNRYWELLDAYLAPRATLVRQPLETVENHILTKAEFSKDSVGLAPTGEKHPEEELQHMNAAYGRAVMKAVMAAIAA